MHIWSGEHSAHWRSGAAGYTDNKAEAGVFDFQDAIGTGRTASEKRDAARDNMKAGLQRYTSKTTTAA